MVKVLLTGQTKEGEREIVREREEVGEIKEAGAKWHLEGGIGEGKALSST